MDILIDKYYLRRMPKTAGVAEGSAAELDELKKKVAVLGIACQAMFELMQEQFEVSEKAILEKMEEIDGRDGSLDGKTAPKVVVCPACGRKTNNARTQCVYCGEALPVGG